MTLGVYIVAKNESDLILGCIQHLKGVDQLVLIDNGSADNTLEIMKSVEGADVYEYPSEERLDMGKLRDFAISKLDTDFIWIVDADEYYEDGAVEKIKEALKNPQAISLRVKYHQMSWRDGYKQANFEHYPDRIYRRDVIDSTSGVLPLDMVKVKKDFYTFRPFLEYDNQEDKSFENPVQPIVDVWYYHLARTRGYNQEITKNIRYQKNMHPDWSDDECKKTARMNQWVTGLYDIEKIETYDIPTKNIPNPKVSVIITNYNYNHYLPETIASIQNQTYKAHEIIVVDDCSKETPTVPEGVKLLVQPENKGVASSRNWGIYESTGDYYICIDGDDLLEPTFIEETLKEMKGDVQIVYSNYKVFGEGNYECDYGEFSSEKLKEFQPIPSCCALIDRHCFELSGGYDPSAHYEDWDYFLNLDKLGFNFKRVNKFLFNYRRHTGSRIDILDQKKEEETRKIKEKYA